MPKENVERWLRYLRNEFPTIAFKASTQTQRTHIGQSSVPVEHASASALATSECLGAQPSPCRALGWTVTDVRGPCHAVDPPGADALIKLLKNYCRNKDIKTSINVGVIGFPNVGKSSLINSLKRSKVCGVGATPGFTKTAQVRVCLCLCAHTQSGDACGRLTWGETLRDLRTPPSPAGAARQEHQAA